MRSESDARLYNLSRPRLVPLILAQQFPQNVQGSILGMTRHAVLSQVGGSGVCRGRSGGRRWKRERVGKKRGVERGKKDSEANVAVYRR